MANEKTKRSVAAVAHALCYSVPFLLFKPSVAAWIVIVVTHFIIDRWRLARFVVYAKNFIAPPPWPTWSRCVATGYDESRPPWLAVWLLIIADNTMHLLCNGAALRFLC